MEQRFQEQWLVQSLHRFTRVYLWMIFKPNFYSPNHCNLWYGLDALMTFFFTWANGKEKLQKFLDDLNSFDNNTKFTHESSNNSEAFKRSFSYSFTYQRYRSTPVL